MGLSRTEQIAAVVEAIFGTDTRTWLDPYQAAGYLGMSTRQLTEWREGKTGPKYHKTPGGAVRYRRTHLDGWMAKHEVETDEGGEA